MENEESKYRYYSGLTKEGLSDIIKDIIEKREKENPFPLFYAPNLEKDINQNMTSEIFRLTERNRELDLESFSLNFHTPFFTRDEDLFQDTDKDSYEKAKALIRKGIEAYKEGFNMAFDIQESARKEKILLASAGSGKTEMIGSRIIYYLRNQTPPAGIPKKFYMVGYEPFSGMNPVTLPSDAQVCVITSTDRGIVIVDTEQSDSIIKGLANPMPKFDVELLNDFCIKPSPETEIKLNQTTKKLPNPNPKHEWKFKKVNCPKLFRRKVYHRRQAR